MEDLDKIQDEAKRNKLYGDYVKSITPKNSLIKDMAAAFLTGGIICCIGQLFLNCFITWGVEEESAKALTSIGLIALAVILTCLHVFGKIAKFGGAGALVPITGFANSVASPAQEYKVEGQVYGIGAKIFTIAGPVILYGVLASFVTGFIYWIFS